MANKKAPQKKAPAVVVAKKEVAQKVHGTPVKKMVDFDAENPAKFLNQNQFTTDYLRQIFDCTGIDDDNILSHIETNIRYGKITEKHFN